LRTTTRASKLIITTLSFADSSLRPCHHAPWRWRHLPSSPSVSINNSPKLRAREVLEGGSVSAAHGCETAQMMRRASSCADDHSPSSTLPPLRWIAEEDLIYDASSRTLHRSACPRLHDLTLLTSVPAGSALELVWAPTICACGPDVTVGLG
jgi:hypothetical protein